jgi:Fe-S cluster assembly protein SufD
MAQMTTGDVRTLQDHFARHADYDTHAFTAMNTAFSSDGAVIRVPEGTMFDRPVHVLYVSVPGAGPQVSHPRGLIIAEPGSQITVIESYLGIETQSDTAAYFTNAVTEIVAGLNANVDHYKIVREQPNAYHVGTTHIRQDRDTTVTSAVITLGGALVRNDVTAVLDGEGAHCTLNGLYIMRDRSHVDNHLTVEHAKPHCDSRQYYKGVLDDHARAVFTGRINVHKDAQKTDAKQTNMNLLLSETAQVDTKPQLEIFADDVKCTHGATIGQIDEQAIFYLQSRGIDETTARGILLFAFANDCLQRVRPEPLQSRLREALYELLPQGDLLREAT